MTITGEGLGWLMLATGAGAFVQAATGFGFAIVAAPVFLAVLESKAGVVLLVALHVVQSLMLVPAAALEAPKRRLCLLLGGAAAGAPLGLMALGALDLRQLKLAAGVVILTIAGLMIWRRRRGPSLPVAESCEPETGAAAETLLAGAVAGALTALLVMPGPPMMLHLMRRPLPAAASRALSLTFFGACYVAVLAMSMAAGDFPRVGPSVAGALAAMVVAGTLAGRAAGRRLVGRHYALALDVLLVLAGVGAILSAL